MDDTAHIRLVHAHTKRIGGHDETTVALHEGVLRAPPLGVTQTGVINETGSPMLVQELCDLLDSAARCRIHNGATRGLGVQNLPQYLELHGLPACPDDTIGEIGAVKPGDK